MVEFITTAGTKLRLLEEEIIKGHMEAVSCFWDEAKGSGTPLIEPCPAKADSVYLSFVYRDSNPNRNIIVFGSFPGYRYKENLLVRLRDTDIWFKTYIIRNDLRFSYSFSIMEHFSEEYQEISKYRKLDGLNPNKIIFHKDEEDSESESCENSLGIMPLAPEYRWTIDDKLNKGGEVVLYRLPELKEKEPRRVWIYVPWSYDAVGQPCNLAVLMDGFDFIEKLNVKNVLDNLQSQNLITPTICVFIDNKDNRYEELTCNDEYSESIITTLVPWVRNHYNVAMEPKRNMIGGFSLGGLAAAYISMKHPEVFGNVLCLSGSFWWKNEKIIKMYHQKTALPLKFYLSVGLLEDEPYDTEPIMMKSVDAFFETIYTKGNPVVYERFHSGHDYLSWGESFGKGLIGLFGRYRETERCILEILKSDDVEEVKKLYINKEVRKYLGGIVDEETFKNRFVDMLDPKDKSIYWVIRKKGTKQFVGMISLDPYHNETETELSYQILPNWWGKGFGEEVARAVLHYGFSEMKQNSIVAETQLKNKASCRLLERLGMKEENRIERFGELQAIYRIDKD